jgi:hypothetical protein
VARPAALVWDGGGGNASAVLGVMVCGLLEVPVETRVDCVVVGGSS